MPDKEPNPAAKTQGGAKPPKKRPQWDPHAGPESLAEHFAFEAEEDEPKEEGET